jgi:cell division transport system ATP-binding protein
MIQFFHVTKKYAQGAMALTDVSVHIEKGEFVFLTGASGAGKTTFLKMIFRDEIPTSGQVVVNTHDVATMPARRVPYLRRQIGVVFQDFKLLPRKTVFENVAFATQVVGLPRREQRGRTYHVLEMLGLNHRLHNYPEQVSGGEQQRMAIARALVNRPLILLADEPTGNLDPDLAQEIMGLFRDINSHGTTVIIATHDRDMIRRMGRRVISLDHGRLAAPGSV